MVYNNFLYLLLFLHWPGFSRWFFYFMSCCMRLSHMGAQLVGNVEEVHSHVWQLMLAVVWELSWAFAKCLDVAPQCGLGLLLNVVFKKYPNSNIPRERVRSPIHLRNGIGVWNLQNVTCAIFYWSSKSLNHPDSSKED